MPNEIQTLEIGSNAPDFTLDTNGGGTISLSALSGRPVVVYFYPKSFLPEIKSGA